MFLWVYYTLLYVFISLYYRYIIFNGATDNNFFEKHRFRNPHHYFQFPVYSKFCGQCLHIYTFVYYMNLPTQIQNDPILYVCNNAYLMGKKLKLCIMVPAVSICILYVFLCVNKKKLKLIMSWNLQVNIDWTKGLWQILIYFCKRFQQERSEIG